MATNYLSETKLQALATRIDQVFLKESEFNTAIADYSTTSQMNAAIASAIDGVTQFDYQVVNELPATGVKGVIYLVPNTGAGTNMYNEYFWVVSGEPAAGHFELFGAKELTIVEYKGSATVNVVDGTGADLGKKVISVKYNTSTLTEDANNGLDLSTATKTSLALADSAVQGFTTTDNSVVVTGEGTTKDLAVSQAIQSGAALGATAIQAVTSTGSSVVVTGEGASKNLEVSQAIQDGAAAGATALQPSDIGEISETTINNLWA